ncbi:hypothetical protein Adi01nite_57390 [Amorphoplanes digitatis]|nr:hypothetical protein Adi01nite_57390 [Actinoplanes digitatis]
MTEQPAGAEATHLVIRPVASACLRFMPSLSAPTPNGPITEGAAGAVVVVAGAGDEGAADLGADEAPAALGLAAPIGAASPSSSGTELLHPAARARQRAAPARGVVRMGGAFQSHVLWSVTEFDATLGTFVRIFASRIRIFAAAPTGVQA